MLSLERAIEISVTAHKEQIDKAGYSLKDELKEFNELLQEQ